MFKYVLLLNALLRGFELASGVNINFGKTQFGIIGGGVNWALEAANILHCRQLDYPFFLEGKNMYINIKQKKIAWVSWTQCCAFRDAGGLGIKDFRILNNSLLIKWKWYMFHQPEQLWNRILISKYQGWRGLDQGPQCL